MVSDARSGGLELRPVTPSQVAGALPKELGAPGRLHSPAGVAVQEGRALVADTGDHCVRVFDLEGKPVLAFGRYGRGEGELRAPADLDVDEDGNVYVADRDNARVCVFDPEGRFLRAWGDWGPYPGLFSFPSAIDVAAGRVHVCDTGNHRVQVFDLAGKYLYEFGWHAQRPREGGGAMSYPDSLAVTDDGRLAAVGESTEERVQLFGLLGPEEDEPRPLLPGVPVEPGTHYGTELDADGTLLAIVAPERHAVQVFDTRFDVPLLVTELGGLGEKHGLMLRPSGVHVDGDARTIAVSDAGLRRLSIWRLRDAQEWEPAYDPLLGVLVRELDFARLFELSPNAGFEAPPEPGAIERDPEGRWYVADTRNGMVLVLGRTLELVRTIPRVGRPTGLAVDAERDRLYVASAAWRGVRALTLAGEPVEKYARAGGSGEEGAPLGLQDVHGVAVDGSGRAFATDPATHRVAVLDEEGELARAWGGAGLGRGELLQPRALAFDGRGRLFVCDHGNHRGQIFDAEGEWLEAFGRRLYVEPARHPAPAASEEGEE